MWNTCPRCGLYRPDKIIDLAGPRAVCPECGHGHPFQMLPLLIVAGASGAGKSTVCQALIGRLTDVVLLDSDILWGPHFERPDPDLVRAPSFFETWLRMAKNLHQAGRPVVIFGAGLGVPENLERCVERRYFSRLHYLALVCDDDVLAARLRARPGWRRSGGAEQVADQTGFNRWFKQRPQELEPRIELLDTTSAPLEQTAAAVAAWIAARAGT